MHDFPSNSDKTRRPEEPPEDHRPKVERITTAEATRRKQGLGGKFKSTFIGGSARLAVEYMVMETVIPAIQDMFIDAFQGGIERLIKGDSARPRRGIPRGYTNVGHVDYTSSSRATPTRASMASRPLSRESRTRQTFDDLLIPSRQEAVDVIDHMFDLLSQYGVVYVADLYELTGIQSSHIDHKWGWTSLRGAKARRMNNGAFLLDLPEPESLD